MVSRAPSTNIWGNTLSDSRMHTPHGDDDAADADAGEGDDHTPHSLATSHLPEYNYAQQAASHAAAQRQKQQQEYGGSHPTQPPSDPVWDPSLNSFACSLDPLPQPYRLIQSVLVDLLDSAWDAIEAREDEGAGIGGGAAARRRRGIVVEGEEVEEEVPTALVQFSAQARLDAKQACEELPVAAPARVVAPAFSPTIAGAENRSLQASSASLSIDGRLAIVGSGALASMSGGTSGGGGSTGNGVFIADLARAYAFVYSLPSEGVVSAVSVSPLPVLRGDEDPEGDETETTNNYLIAWAVTTPAQPAAATGSSSAAATAAAAASGVGGAAATTTTVKVATVNAHAWEFYEGCTLHLPVASARSAAATAAVLGAGSSATAVVGLQFASDASHLAVSMADGSHAVYALRAHRFDPMLVPPKISQKEQLLGTGAAAASKAGTGATTTAASRLHPSSSAAAVAAAAAAAASTAELHSILNDASDFHLHGLSFVEPRALVSLQAKLYTPTLVLHTPVPKTLLDNILREAAASAPAVAAGTRASSASSNPSKAAAAANSSSKAASPLSPSSSSKVPRRGSTSVGATPPAAPLSPSASTSVAASPRPVSAAPTAAATPAAASRSCLALSSVHFVCAAPPRRLGSAPPAVVPARGFIVAWERDCAWHRWDLASVKPVEAGQSPAALAMLAARPKTPGQIAPGTAAGAKESKKEEKASKASKHDAAAAAAAAASAAAAVFPGLTATETALCVRPLPPACSTVVGSGVCVTAMDVSGSFLALGLACGTVVLYDCRLGGALRLQMHGTPVTSHGGLDAFTPASTPASTARVTSLAWFGCSHLVAGLGDCTVRTFFLPPNLERQGSDRLGADARVAVRVSTKLPGGGGGRGGSVGGGVCSVRIGTKLPLALIGVSAGAVDPSSQQPLQQAQQMFFVYDFLSNHVIGRLLPNGGSGSAGGRPDHGHSHPASPGRFSGGGAQGSLSSPLSRTREFTVYEEKDDGGGSVRLSSLTSANNAGSGGMQLRASNEGDYTERSAADEGAYSYRGVGNSGAMDSLSAGGASTTTSFHPLSQASGCFATLAADQIVVLGCSSSAGAAASSSSSSASSSACLLIYPVSDLIVSLYPSISSACSNAFLRQQHAQSFFAEHPLHADRRAPAAFSNYLAALDAVVAASNQEALSRAFAQGRSGQIKSSYAGSSSGGGRAAGHSRKPSSGSFGGGSSGAAAAAGRSRAYHPLLSSIHSRSGSVSSSTGGGSGAADRLGMPGHAAAGHARQGSTSSSASVASHMRTGSSASQRHTRSSSRSPDRGARSAAAAAALGADPLSAHLPRDAAFLMHAALAATVASSVARSPAALKARRAEMAAQLKAEAQQQQRNARFGGELRAQQTLVLPRIMQAQR